MKIGLVVPHIFMQQALLPHVIFSPGELALSLAEEMQSNGHKVTLFTPGRVLTKVKNVNADLSYFEDELRIRNDNYLDLLKKHPLTFITLSRQIQSELIAKVYELANQDKLDIVHIYTNEEDIAVHFARFSKKPVIFTHHDPFNFLVQYKSLFPKYYSLNWLSLSYAQRKAMPQKTNWVANIYHGLDKSKYKPNYSPEGNYVAYMGRIIESKGVHLAIQAVKNYNKVNPSNPLRLKIAGKHYSSKHKNDYWQQKILPNIDGEEIEYIGHLSDIEDKQKFLGNAEALLLPSTYEEPFGMVSIEALACATPVLCLASGALPEIIVNGRTGYVINKTIQKDNTREVIDEKDTIKNLSAGLTKIKQIDRTECRQQFEKRFSLERMCQDHIEIYEKILQNN